MTFEELLTKVDELQTELDAWAAGERSVQNKIPYPALPENQDSWWATVAMADAAQIMMLSAQLTATVARLQLMAGAR